MTSAEQVKQRIEIVTLAGESCQLQRAGRMWRARCPFHQERTPSFYVDPDRQTWHCFGACGTGGDVFSFVMRRDGVDFRTALEHLAERAGVELARGSTRGGRSARGGPAQQALEAAARFWQEQLWHDVVRGKDGEVARRYLERRGVDRASAERFELGYAPEDGHATLEFLRGRGFDDVALTEAGLVVDVAGSGRGGRDRFRGRLMFPVRDERGRLAGFGGRVLGEGEPKYLNSPQGPLFDKGGLLYGLHLAREAARREDRLVIVEGYMDVIAAHQHGFQNVVAGMGTSLTERQAKLARRFTGVRTIVLALDADPAGQKAIIRGLPVLLHALADDPGYFDAEALLDPARQHRGVDLRALVLPDGSDPDDLVRHDPDRWRQLVEDAPRLLDHVVQVAAAAADLVSPEGRAAFVASLRPLLEAIDDPVLRAAYGQRIASLAGVDAEAVVPRRGSARSAAASAPRAPAREPGPATLQELDALALVVALGREAAEEAGVTPDRFLAAGAAELCALLLVRRAADDGPLEDALPTELEPLWAAVTARRLTALSGPAARQELQHLARWLDLARLRQAEAAVRDELGRLEASAGAGRIAALAAQAAEEDDGPSSEESEVAREAARLWVELREVQRAIDRARDALRGAPAA